MRHLFLSQFKEISAVIDLCQRIANCDFLQLLVLLV